MLPTTIVLTKARRGVEVGKVGQGSPGPRSRPEHLGFVAAELGHVDAARETTRELVTVLAGASANNVHRTLELAWFAEELECEDALRRLALGAAEGHPWREAMLAVLDADYARAARVRSAIGHVDAGTPGFERESASSRTAARAKPRPCSRRRSPRIDQLEATRYLRAGGEAARRSRARDSRVAPARARSPRRAT